MSLQLQWRAGQLPGRTGVPILQGDLTELASMEGRAIARPDVEFHTIGEGHTTSFNGGPGNCPAGRTTRQ